MILDNLKKMGFEPRHLGTFGDRSEWNFLETDESGGFVKPSDMPVQLRPNHRIGNMAAKMEPNRSRQLGQQCLFFIESKIQGHLKAWLPLIN